MKTKETKVAIYNGITFFQPHGEHWQFHDGKHTLYKAKETDPIIDILNSRAITYKEWKQLNERFTITTNKNGKAITYKK